MFSKFFEGIATEHLLGLGIKAEHITDDRMGNVLDALREKGLSETFLSFILKAIEKYKVNIGTAHLDSSSFHVDGKYENQGEGSIEITQGYSRDHRPELKQFMMNLICTRDGDIPLKQDLRNYCKNLQSSGHLKGYA